MTELRRTLRSFIQCPGFTAVAIISLALGIGANTAIFSLFNSVALRTLAAPQPDRLAGLFTVDAAGARGKFSYAAFEQIRTRQQSFASLFVWTDSALRTFEAEGTVFPGSALLASDGFAETMRMRPVIGRGIAAGDADVAILGYQCWRRYFHGRADALGKTIRVQGKACTVVGVAPEDFTTIEASGTVEAIVPLSALTGSERAFRISDWRLIDSSDGSLGMLALPASFFSMLIGFLPGLMYPFQDHVVIAIRAFDIRLFRIPEYQGSY